MQLLNSNIITVDGESACGKTSIAELIARKLGMQHIDSGLLFRSVAYLVHRYQLNNEDISIEKLDTLFKSSVSISGQVISVDSVVVSDFLKEEKWGMLAAILGRQEKVQTWFIHLLREIVSDRARLFIVSGRIGGSIIFPDAYRKFYLHADLYIKTVRRYQQLKDDSFDCCFEEIRECIRQRDDMSNIIFYWDIGVKDETIMIDTTHLSFGSLYEKLSIAIFEKGVA